MPVDRLPITGLVVGVVPPAVLVCGDPARASKAATMLEEPAILTDQREYRCIRGSYKGILVTVCSHGIGAPGAAIAFEELIVAGGQRLIRIGTCGGLQPNIVDGALVIATGAVQQTGYGRQVAPQGYPAVADYRLVNALNKAARAAGQQPHTGLVLTSDSFYPGVISADTPDYRQLSSANVLAVEMECAALFLLGGLRNVATAAILAVDGNVLEKRESVESYQPHRQVVAVAVEAEIEIALEALLLLA